jgi:hypothetical protein
MREPDDKPALLMAWSLFLLLTGSLTRWLISVGFSVLAIVLCLASSLDLGTSKSTSHMACGKWHSLPSCPSARSPSVSGWK